VSFVFNALVDTCVWLDLAKNARQAPLLGVIEEMVKQKLVMLLVPRIVLDEFRRNRGRIITESTKASRLISVWLRTLSVRSAGTSEGCGLFSRICMM
jgi:hypothetical protein